MTISVRVVLSTAAVLSMVMIVNISSQLTTDITLSKVQLIWIIVASWLRPPYLYLVVNFIIITIFASSRLHHHHDYSEPIKFFPTDNNYYEGEDQSKLVDIMQMQSSTEIVGMEFSDALYGNENYSVPTTKTTLLVDNVQPDVSSNANLSYSDDGTTESASFETCKLPGSASFVHPKVVEAKTKGKKKLGVPNPEQELETLESAWKAITDGCPMPIIHQHSGGGNMQDCHKMIKSETFNQQLSSNQNNKTRALAESSRSGKLKRDPSPGQDELNKRVEAFISRFKEDMRLQRKESLRQYAEMINSGAY